jgi:hypothetical protein
VNWVRRKAGFRISSSREREKLRNQLSSRLEKRLVLFFLNSGYRAVKACSFLSSSVLRFDSINEWFTGRTIRGEA